MRAPERPKAAVSIRISAYEAGTAMSPGLLFLFRAIVALSCPLIRTMSACATWGIVSSRQQTMDAAHRIRAHPRLG
ncbi:hypothetical protein GCM10027056_12410 [Glaciibacter psychrotolerans]